MRISDWSSDVCLPAMLTLLPSVTLPPTVPSTTKPFGPSPVPVAAEMMTVGPDAVAEYSGDDVLLLICAATAEIGRAHVCTPVTHAHLVCRLLLAQIQPDTLNPKIQ